jgi:FdhD protein
MPAAEQPIRFTRFRASSGWKQEEGQVITEASVGLSVNGDAWLTFACTPVDLQALGAGFLFNEGIIHTREEIANLTLCAHETNIDVWLNHPAEKPVHWQRTSGCSGGAAPASDFDPTAWAQSLQDSPNDTDRRYSPGDLLASMEQLLNAQDLYRSTGGVHSSAVIAGGQMIAHAEDIGRHNTLDKIAGKLLLSGLTMQAAVLLTTGRISSEMLQKAARLRVSIIVSRSSPTSESIRLADLVGITLAGYARRDQFILYSHPERLVPEFE